MATPLFESITLFKAPSGTCGLEELAKYELQDPNGAWRDHTTLQAENVAQRRNKCDRLSDPSVRS